MQYLRAFIAGIVFPSVVLSIALFFALVLGKAHIMTKPFLHIIPILWGVWNVLYFTYFYKFLHRNQNVRLFITGAVLGLVVATFATWLRLPEEMGISAEYWYLPLIIAPMIYGFIWVFVVKPLNEVVGLSDSNWISFR